MEPLHAPVSYGAGAANSDPLAYIPYSFPSHLLPTPIPEASGLDLVGKAKQLLLGKDVHEIAKRSATPPHKKLEKAIYWLKALHEALHVGTLPQIIRCLEKSNGALELITKSTTEYYHIFCLIGHTGRRIKIPEDTMIGILAKIEQTKSAITDFHNCLSLSSNDHIRSRELAIKQDILIRNLVRPNPAEHEPKGLIFDFEQYARQQEGNLDAMTHILTDTLGRRILDLIDEKMEAVIDNLHANIHGRPQYVNFSSPQQIQPTIILPAAPATPPPEPIRVIPYSPTRHLENFNQSLDQKLSGVLLIFALPLKFIAWTINTVFIWPAELLLNHIVKSAIPSN